MTFEEKIIALKKAVDSNKTPCPTCIYYAAHTRGAMIQGPCWMNINLKSARPLIEKIRSQDPRRWLPWEFHKSLDRSPASLDKEVVDYLYNIMLIES